MTRNKPNAAGLRGGVTIVIAALVLTSCAAQKPVITPLAAPVIAPIKAVSESAQEMTISLFAANRNDAERWAFYHDFAEKGLIPLQIEIDNPTEHTFTLEDTQYAICDPRYQRTRRAEAKDMALTQVGILTAGTERTFFWSWLKRKLAARRMKKDFEKIEFEMKEIPPRSTIRGWLYFKMQEESFEPRTLYKNIATYELEIAHIKNSGTNVVTNFYLPLEEFTREFSQE